MIGGWGGVGLAPHMGGRPVLCAPCVSLHGGRPCMVGPALHGGRVKRVTADVPSSCRGYHHAVMRALMIGRVGTVRIRGAPIRRAMRIPGSACLDMHADC
jgi:hypothetical protein